MAWTAPPTYTVGQVLSAANLNTYLRDNSNYFKGSASNSVAASESTASGTYANLATVGPSVTITTDVQAWVTLAARVSNNTVASFAFMGFAVNGVLPADDSQAIGHALGSNAISAGAGFLVTGLTPGSNTFLAKYRVTGNTGTWLNRCLAVEPA